MSRYITSFYPESKFGGFTDVDGTIAFYSRVNALLAAPSVVLDFGCGRGSYQQDAVPFRLQLRVVKGKVARVIGLDVDPTAQENPFVDDFRLLRPGQAWPVEAGSIDLVLSDYVLEHLPDPEQFFAESMRALRRGGNLCIRTPNVLSYFGVISWLVPTKHRDRFLGVAQPDREEAFPTLYRCNTIWRLRRVMAKHGFDHVVYGYEAEPSYLNFSKFFYALGVLHQKLAPKMFRLNIFAFGRRDSGAQT